MADEKMTCTLEEFRFWFKFRFHRLLAIPVSETDYDRLAAIYGVDAALVAAETRDIEANNLAYAEKLAAERDLSCLDSVPPTRILFLGDSITADRKSFCEILKKVFAITVTTPYGYLFFAYFRKILFFIKVINANFFIPF